MRILIAALLLSFVAACGGKPHEYYAPPVIDAATPTVVGSRIYRDSDFEGDLRSFLWGVDGRQVESGGGMDRWTEVIPVAPGRHQILIHVFKGGFPKTWGSALLEVTFEPGGRYKVVSTYPVDGEPPLAWLEKTAGERVSDKVHVPLRAGQAPAVIFLP